MLLLLYGYHLARFAPICIKDAVLVSSSHKFGGYDVIFMHVFFLFSPNLESSWLHVQHDGEDYLCGRPQGKEICILRSTFTCSSTFSVIFIGYH